MRIVIAGTRTLNIKARSIRAKLGELGWVDDSTEIVTGGGGMVDRAAILMAHLYEFERLTVFEAQWRRYGKSAGPIRNMKMAHYSNALLAYWDGKSRGTKDMIEQANLYGLKVHVERIDAPTNAA